MGATSGDSLMLPRSEICRVTACLPRAASFCAKKHEEYCPVRSEYRLGVQSGDGVCASAKRTPLRASWSA